VTRENISGLGAKACTDYGNTTETLSPPLLLREPASASTLPNDRCLRSGQQHAGLILSRVTDVVVDLAVETGGEVQAEMQSVARLMR
jgi:hypothetical protein